MIHIGLDPSLTSFGAAVLEPGADARLAAFPSKAPGSNSLAIRRDRLDHQVREVFEFIGRIDWTNVRVYIEAPTYATNSGSQHDRSGLWWLAVESLLDRIPFPNRVIEVSPTSAKAFATGAGNASKEMMSAAAARAFPYLPISEFRASDKSDALWIATLSEYVENPDVGRVDRTKYRDKAASGVPRA